MRGARILLCDSAANNGCMGSQSQTWSALYAKNTAKKNKKWLDGTLHARQMGSRWGVTLKTETGVVLEEVRCTAAARIPLACQPHRPVARRATSRQASFARAASSLSSSTWCRSTDSQTARAHSRAPPRLQKQAQTSAAASAALCSSPSSGLRSSPFSGLHRRRRAQRRFTAGGPRRLQPLFRARLATQPRRSGHRWPAAQDSTRRRLLRWAVEDAGLDWAAR